MQLKFILAYMQLKFIVLQPLILCFREVRIDNIFSLQFLTLTLWVHTQCVMKPSSISKGWTRERSFFCGLIINISATLQYTAAWYQIHVSAAKVLGPSLNRSARENR